MTIISLIVAMDRNGVIGADGALPWHLPADLRHFRAVTMGKPIVMGRRTHESIGRPLPGRENIVLTRDRDYGSAGCTVLHSLDEVTQHCAGSGEIMIMGGADIYAQALPLAERIYLTRVQAAVDGDTYFPELDARQWRAISREDHRADEANPHAYSFIVLERRGA